MSYAEEDATEAPELRWLRRLVIFLTITMIGGFIILILLFVIRFQQLGGGGQLAFPSEITLPEGASAVSFTQAPGWYAVVTDADEILVFDRDSGTLIKSVKIESD